MCGCGETIPIKDNKGRRLSYKLYHYSRTVFGEQCSNWKGGKCHSSSGYLLVKSRGHPRADKESYVPEHILVMEKHLGRPILKGEIIHHKNGIKDDNRIENLELMNGYSKHMSNHQKERRKTFLLMSNLIQLLSQSDDK